MNRRGQHRQERIYRFRYTRRGRGRSIRIFFQYGEVVLVYRLSPILSRRGDVKLQQGEPREVFNSMIYVSVVRSRRQTYPRRLLQMYLIFVPGLLKHEARKVSNRMKGSILLLVRGSVCSVKIFIPWMVSQLYQFSHETLSSERREGALRVSYTLHQIRNRRRGRVRRLHIPRVLLTISKERGRELDVNDSRRNYRRQFILRTRRVGALLTPPDIISQVRVALPRRLMRERTIVMKCRQKAREERKTSGT